LFVRYTLPLFPPKENKIAEPEYFNDNYWFNCFSQHRTEGTNGSGFSTCLYYTKCDNPASCKGLVYTNHHAVSWKSDHKFQKAV